MSDLLPKIESYVFNLFKDNLKKNYVYHTFLHTQRVVDSAVELLNNLKVTDEEAQVVLIASWFHDTGHIYGPENHEKKSVEIAIAFLKNEEVSGAIITQVTNCILATKLSAKPNNFLEEIVKDADTSHFAKKYFKQVSELLRQELSIQGIAHYSRKEWKAENIKLFTERHKYYTPYAVKNWEEKKNKNLTKLLQKKQKSIKKQELESFKAKVKAKYKNDNPERGIQTLYRVTLRNHIKLSDIADTKANILLSVNAIIISLALANLIPKLDSPSNYHLIWPSLILVLFSVASVILSILSTQPKVTSGEFTKEQVKNRDVNLLFFGNFHKMSFQDYSWGLKEVLKDKDYIYEMLTKDLYLLGIVLDRKYKLLKITYVVFTIGIVVSVVAFIIAFIHLK